MSNASKEQPQTTVLLLDKEWERIQKKTFCKWINSKLVSRLGEDAVKELTEDLSDGVKLIVLLEVIGGESLGKFVREPKLRMQKVENVNKALDFVTRRGVKLVNIGGPELVDKSEKLMLGLIWSIILRFTISDITEDGRSAKEGLLIWCQRKTKGYKDVNVQDFTFSFQDGLAFCALIHKHRPDLLDFDKLSKQNKADNLNLAFDVAEKQLGIPRLLDVDDIVNIAKPDERSIMTYVASYFHAFAKKDKYETAGRRIAKFAAIAKSIWDMQNEYEQRCRKLLANVNGQIQKWTGARFDGSYADCIEQNRQFAQFKAGEKRAWYTEKENLHTLLNDIHTKLLTYKMHPYSPPAGLFPEDLEKTWSAFNAAETQRRKDISEKLRQIKEALRVEFAQLAHAFHAQTAEITKVLGNLDGELEAQLNTVRGLSSRFAQMEKQLVKLADSNRRCLDANIEENEHTVYSYDDLEFELSLVKALAQKKTAFIENQIVARGVTNITPQQLEEFEQTFRHFDFDGLNVLNREQFQACLQSLGEPVDEPEFSSVFDRVAAANGVVPFDKFVQYMVSITEDNTNADQVMESFRTLAHEKEYLTEDELRAGKFSETELQYLMKEMPRNANGFDYKQYLQSRFSN